MSAGAGSRTLVCSVLFLDIADYSKHGVGEQIKLKEKFNQTLAASLADLETRDRVVIDTGDGAAIAFLGDPEAALFAALAIFDNVGELPVRMGINLGPVYLTKDLNGQENVIGDGINVAQRVMSFAGKGELLVSRSFYEVVLLLSGEYSTLFQPLGSRADKHNRAHEVYSVSQAVRVGRRVAEAQARQRSQRKAAPAPPAHSSVTVSDAGTHFIVSGPTREALQPALDALRGKGHKLLAAAAQVGNKWIATVDNPELAVAATVEKLGMRSLVTGPTREAVELKVKELLAFGARLDQEIELVDGVWTAVCDNPG
jgi:class 3 adenylate cyclase